MLRRPPRSTRTDTLFPYTTLFRSARTVECLEQWLVGTLEAHAPIGAVLDDRDAARFGEGDKRFAPRRRHGGTGRVVEFGDIIDQLGQRTTRCRAAVERGLQRRDVEPMRSEEHRLGKEGVSTVRSRSASYTDKKKTEK